MLGYESAAMSKLNGKPIFKWYLILNHSISCITYNTFHVM